MSQKWYKGYKLLDPYNYNPDEQRHKRGRVSLCVGNSPTRVVRYPLMEEARPQPGAGPLTVFTRKADIQKFFDANGWEDTTTVVRCVFIKSADQEQGLWGVNTFGRRFTKLPKGTVLADVVLCLE